MKEQAIKGILNWENNNFIFLTKKGNVDLKKFILLFCDEIYSENKQYDKSELISITRGLIKKGRIILDFKDKKFFLEGNLIIEVQERITNEWSCSYLSKFYIKNFDLADNILKHLKGCEGVFIMQKEYEII